MNAVAVIPSSPIVMSPRDFVEKVLGFPLGRKSAAVRCIFSASLKMAKDCEIFLQKYIE